MIYADAGTTWSKIITINEKSDFEKIFSKYFQCEKDNKKYYIIPSALIKDTEYKFTAATGHMAKNSIENNSYLNEILALAKGAFFKKHKSGLILDLGSRDIKWVQFDKAKFKDLDWNNSCASATGATVEMLLKFYNVKIKDLKFTKEKYNITCGIFGLEKIMDDIANGESANIAISKFIHGIAYNAWVFAKKPKKIYLSGGFCSNKCFTDSLANYTKIYSLGRFLLVEGLICEFSMT